MKKFDFEKLKNYGYKENDLWVLVKVNEQKLYLLQGKKVLKEYAVSTAKNGVGNVEGSFCTPLGLHRICEKIGKGLPLGAVLKGRKFTGEIADIEKRPVSTGKDLITTRILWLEGLEEGKNRGYNEKGRFVDTKKRYIYIHGTNEEGLIGKPVSHGCIRMKNKDILDLWEKIEKGIIVLII
nr:L,D-transpeptidase [Thermotomaculum hydrothermale]